MISAVPDSAACRYAQSNWVDYQAGTVYRALLIGQTYPDKTALKLSGPYNDVVAIDRCIKQFHGTPYQTTICMNLTAEGIISAISDVFRFATSEDVSLFYYSGHGVSSEDPSKQGALLGADNEGCVTASQLRSALDRIPGRKIIIIDACYSGNMLSKKQVLPTHSTENTSPKATQSSESFVDSFVSAFSRRNRSNLAGENYFVLTSAANNEMSFEDQIGDRIMGLFTSHLVLGCGYDVSSDCTAGLLADSNGNGVLTLQEVFQYVRRHLVAEGQHARVYPGDCSWFGILRQ